MPARTGDLDNHQFAVDLDFLDSLGCEDVWMIRLERPRQIFCWKVEKYIRAFACSAPF